MLCENCKQPIKQRTLSQNASLHLWFTQVSELLNEHGFDMRVLIKEEIDIPWNTATFKEYIWKPVQLAVIGEKSTTKLKTKDIDKIYDIINKVIGERTGLHIPFPCIDELIYKDK